MAEPRHAFFDMGTAEQARYLMRTTMAETREIVRQAPQGDWLQGFRLCAMAMGFDRLAERLNGIVAGLSDAEILDDESSEDSSEGEYSLMVRLVRKGPGQEASPPVDDAPSDDDPDQEG